MALTPPTVASDPASVAEVNAALVILNGYVTAQNNATILALTTLRQLFLLADGNTMVIEAIDAALADLAAGVPDPSVADQTPGAGNTALTTLTNAIIDVASTESSTGTTILENSFKRALGSIQAVTDWFGASATIAASNFVPETVTTNPVPKAEWDTALANTTAFIDTLNANTLATFAPFRDIIKRRGATQTMLADYDNALVALAP